jgi:hypothetical protein
VVCCLCGRTWTLHRRRRGRPRLRTDRSLPAKLLLKKQPAAILTDQRQCSASTFYRHARAAFDQMAAEPYWPALSETEDYILLADGLWFDFQGSDMVMYNFLLRPICSNQASPLNPVMLPGKEYEQTWRLAISQVIPASWQRRIRALVADGFSGAGRIAAERNWIYQRCHWHLLSSLESMSGRRCRRTHGRVIRETIIRLVRELIATRDEQRLPMLCSDLRALAQDEYLRNRRIRYKVSNLLKDVDCLRAYIRHPELRLPTTTGTVESLHALIRPAVRCISRPAAALARTRCLVRLHRAIACNEHGIPQN